MSDPIFGVSDAIAVLNQTLEMVYPTITVVGELSSFNISRGRWVYADLKDEVSKIRLFGTIYQLPGPLEDGMMLEVVAEPRLHPQFGFSLNIRTIRPVGEGSIKKAANLLQAKLEAEGLFAPERKRSIPYAPERVALVASEQSAAYADFIKILNARWQGVEVNVFDVVVQGESAVESIVGALSKVNQLAEVPDVLVLIRGGGSADDLSAFSSEQVTRAVAGSRIPTVVAIGHEVDVCLAELASDLRASTPSNAAELLFPDKKNYLQQLDSKRSQLADMVVNRFSLKSHKLETTLQRIQSSLENFIDLKLQKLDYAKSILSSAHPDTMLKKGYTLITADGKLVSKVKDLKIDQEIMLTMQDGSAKANIVDIQ